MEINQGTLNSVYSSEIILHFLKFLNYDFMTLFLILIFSL